MREYELVKEHITDQLRWIENERLAQQVQQSDGISKRLWSIIKRTPSLASTTQTTLNPSTTTLEQRVTP